MIQRFLSRAHFISALFSLLVFMMPPDSYADEMFSVEGLSPGMSIGSDWLTAQAYKCTPSEDYPGFTWCRKHDAERRQGTEIKLSRTIVYGPDQSIAYINKELSPAYLSLTDIEKEMNRLSTRFKSRPRQYSSGLVSGQTSAYLASWGGIELSPLAPEKRGLLVQGERAHAGILVDLLGKFGESAQAGLPIYSLSGKLGFIWQATSGSDGQGRLRFFAADPSRLPQKNVYGPAVAARPSPSPAEGRSVSPPPAPPTPAPSEQVVGTGTGFFISPDGYLLSNAHVVDGCSSVQVLTAEFGSLNARVVATDTHNDVALIRAGQKPSEYGRLRSGIRTGESITVFGYPLYGILARTGNFTVGNISATAGLADDTRFLQISAPVQPGNSGGPVLDQYGNVVGMVVSKLNVLKVASAINDIPQNVNFAIKAGVLANFLETTPASAGLGAANSPFSLAELADKAKAISVLVKCSR